MEKTRRILPPEVLLEEYRQLLQNEEIESLPLVISGNSMSPFLIHGRDTVYLSRLKRPAKGEMFSFTNGITVLMYYIEFIK